MLENYHIGINASTLGTGYAEIELFAKFNYPYPHQKYEKKLIEKIEIIDTLKHGLIQFIHSPENLNIPLILPPRSEYHLKLNMDISKVFFSIE